MNWYLALRLDCKFLHSPISECSWNWRLAKLPQDVAASARWSPEGWAEPVDGPVCCSEFADKSGLPEGRFRWQSVSELCGHSVSASHLSIGKAASTSMVALLALPSVLKPTESQPPCSVCIMQACHFPAPVGKSCRGCGALPSSIFKCPSLHFKTFFQTCHRYYSSLRC